MNFRSKDGRRTWLSSNPLTAMQPPTCYRSSTINISIILLLFHLVSTLHVTLHFQWDLSRELAISKKISVPSLSIRHIPPNNSQGHPSTDHFQSLVPTSRLNSNGRTNRLRQPANATSLCSGLLSHTGQCITS